MPRIQDEILDCVLYLYPTTEAAQQGLGAGGTGFWVLWPSEVHSDYKFTYAVTAKHVIREGHSPIIRVNDLGGGSGAWEMDESDWIDHADGDDISAAEVGLIPNVQKWKAVPRSMFLTKDILREWQIGPGDDTYIVGRFSAHDGRNRNLPSVRFGNIAMMPWEPVKHPAGHLQESFLVEMRSIGGYSGSPVFVHIPSFSLRPGNAPLDVTPHGPWLLGVDWGHLHNYERVLDRTNTPTPDGLRVKSNSGMTGVVPAWKLDELLNREEFVMRRKELNDKITMLKESEQSGVTLDLAKMDEPIFTEDDFEEALRKVSRKDKPTNDTKPND